MIVISCYCDNLVILITVSSVSVLVVNMADVPRGQESGKREMPILDVEGGGGHAAPNRTGPLIRGGVQTSIEEFPWAVVVGKQERWVCSGSVLDELHVLTAAHCVTSPESSRAVPRRWLRVRAGSSHKEEGGVVRGVERVYVHPEYDWFEFWWDLAVLRLDAELPLGTSTLAKATLATQDMNLERLEQEGAECLVAGWGGVTPDDLQGSPVIRATSLPLITFSSCEDIINADRENMINRRMHVCTLGDAKDTCLGDSGGGLVCTEQKVVWGVTSFGRMQRECGARDNPGVYARVDTAAAFIRAALAGTAAEDRGHEDEFKAGHSGARPARPGRRRRPRPRNTSASPRPTLVTSLCILYVFALRIHIGCY